MIFIYLACNRKCCRDALLTILLSRNSFGTIELFLKPTMLWWKMNNIYFSKMTFTQCRKYISVSPLRTYTQANMRQPFFFKINFEGHKSFLWDHWCPCFGPLVISALGFKARVDPFLLTCVILRFTYCATPADCVEVSMAVKLFWSTYLQIMGPQALVGVQTHDHTCHSTTFSTIRSLRLGLWDNLGDHSGFCHNSVKSHLQAIVMATFPLTAWSLKNEPLFSVLVLASFALVFSNASNTRIH